MSVWDELQERNVARRAQIRALLGARIDVITAAQDFGSPTAAKRGRNPRFPYVPVVRYQDEHGYTRRTEQLRGLAYADRADAVKRATHQIDARRLQMAEDLCDPRMRAFREQHGLPRDPL